jgi:hypothetical protein
MSIIKWARCEIEPLDGVADLKQSRVTTAALRDFDFIPEPGMLYVTARAISSRVNANYDGWPAEELRKGYRTFIGRPVFVDHNNHNPENSRGVILDAKLRESRLASGVEDTWVELLIEVDARAYPRLARAIEDGQVDAVSMGADVEYTICSVCANKAHDVSEYCAHVPQMKGQKVQTEHVDEQGRTSSVRKLCFETCYGVNFFEISFVFDPADESADVTGVLAGSATASLRVTRKVRRVGETVPDYQRRAGGIAKAAQRQSGWMGDPIEGDLGSVCEGCGAPVHPTAESCPSCGYWMGPYNHD